MSDQQDSTLNRTQEIKGGLESAELRLSEEGGEALHVKGWFACRYARISLVQLGVSGGPLVIARPSPRRDLAASLPELRPEQHAGFEETLALDSNAALPETLHFLLHLDNGQSVTGGIALPHPLDRSRFSAGCPRAVRDAAVRTAVAEFDAFRETRRSLRFSHAAEPAFSVIIGAGEAYAVYRCLTRLKQSTDLPCEIFIVDGAVKEALNGRVAGVRYYRADEEAAGFRQAVEAASAPLIVALGSDTAVATGALDALCEVLVQMPDTAAVCGRLLRPDGRIAACGAARSSGGGAFEMRGAGEDALSPTLLSLQAVGFCTPACFAARRDLLLQHFPGADLFVPAVWRFCAACRRQGFSILYEPEALAVLHQGVAGAALEKLAVAYAGSAIGAAETARCGAEHQRELALVFDRFEDLGGLETLAACAARQGRGVVCYGASGIAIRRGDLYQRMPRTVELIDGRLQPAAAFFEQNAACLRKVVVLQASLIPWLSQFVAPDKICLYLPQGRQLNERDAGLLHGARLLIECEQQLGGAEVERWTVLGAPISAAAFSELLAEAPRAAS